MRSCARSSSGSPGCAAPSPAALPALTTFFDESRGSALPLPAELERVYGGPLRFPPDRPHVYANFVQTIDGLVSYGIPGEASARVISRGDPGDRSVMGILRAAADVIVSGAGTLRVETGVTWTPWQAYAPLRDAYVALRRALGRPDRVKVAVVSESGDLDLGLPVFGSDEVDALIVTSRAGAERLGTLGTRGIAVAAVPGSPPSMRSVIDAVADWGGGLILSEAGPRLFGRMLRERAVHELFLSVAPRLAGRSPERLGVPLVEGTAFVPAESVGARPISAKRAGELLLLRYSLQE